MSEGIFQSIYDELEPYIQFQWDKLVVYLEYGEASYTFLFYVKTQDRYIQCYDINGIDEDALTGSFEKIDAMIEKERTSGKHLWSNMTIVVDKNGDMNADYDYTDLSNGNYKYIKEWKDKYLV